MRCAFTMGIVDALLDENIQIDEVYGISAGTIAGAPYVSGQQGFAHTFRPDGANALSLTQFMTEDGRLSMVDMANAMLPQLAPFDFDAYIKGSKTLWMGAMRADDLSMKYFGKSDLKDAADFWKKSMASSSLPDVAVPVEIDGVAYYDGGLVEAIPLEQGIRDGHTKHVVVLTQDRSYVKQPYSITSGGKDRLVTARAKHPRIDEVFVNRYVVYNETRTRIEEMVQTGEVLAFYPSNPVDIGTFEIHPMKLAALYQDGWEQAKERREELRRFIV